MLGSRLLADCLSQRGVFQPARRSSPTAGSPAARIPTPAPEYYSPEYAYQTYQNYQKYPERLVF